MKLWVTGMCRPVKPGASRSTVKTQYEPLLVTVIPGVSVSPVVHAPPRRLPLSKTRTVKLGAVIVGAADGVPSAPRTDAP